MICVISVRFSASSASLLPQDKRKAVAKIRIPEFNQVFFHDCCDKLVIINQPFYYSSYLLEYVFVQFPFDVFFEVFCFVLFRRMAKERAEVTR